MKRREFLKAGVTGAAAASAVGVGGIAVAGEGKASGAEVDPDGLAKAAVAHFLPGGKTCSESILMAGCETLGIQCKLVPDVALGLAGGLGLQGKTCGTIAAAAMVLSLAVAADEPDYPKKKTRVLKAVGSLYKRFEEKFGTTDCRKLSGLDLTTPEGREVLKQRVKAETCRGYVHTCARILAEILPEA